MLYLHHNSLLPVSTTLGCGKAACSCCWKAQGGCSARQAPDDQDALDLLRNPNGVELDVDSAGPVLLLQAIFGGYYV
jgi:hypothetical protein